MWRPLLLPQMRFIIFLPTSPLELASPLDPPLVSPSIVVPHLMCGIINCLLLALTICLRMPRRARGIFRDRAGVISRTADRFGSAGYYKPFFSRRSLAAPIDRYVLTRGTSLMAYPRPMSGAHFHQLTLCLCARTFPYS